MSHDGSIEDEVLYIVSYQFGIDTISLNLNTSFVSDLDADSMDCIDLVMQFEDQFEMAIPDEDIDGIKTIGQAIDYIMTLEEWRAAKNKATTDDPQAKEA